MDAYVGMVPISTGSRTLPILPVLLAIQSATFRTPPTSGTVLPNTSIFEELFINLQCLQVP